MQHKRLSLGMIVVVFFTVLLSFFFGIHWQGTFGNWMVEKNAIKTLSCFGNNNFTETFQTDCYVPSLVINQPFAYKTQLSCQVMTNHQFDVMYDAPFYNISLIKSDYVHFSLGIDEQKKTLERSNTGGEMSSGPYTIIQDDDFIIHAMRKNIFDSLSINEYEYITLSKKTGRGIRSWMNIDVKDEEKSNIASDFFQCE